MARAVTAYADGKGKLFAAADQATLSDLARAVGKVGSDDESGAAADGIAKLIFENRAAIEAVFADHDALTPNGRALEKTDGRKTHD